MMELMEAKDTKEEWKLPRNVRQIGEPGQEIRILIEDYVYTYLHQLSHSNLTCMKTAILLGKVEEGSRFYVQGAMEIDMGQEISGWFTHEHWRTIFEESRSWFEGLEVVGWFMANPGFPAVLTGELKELHDRNFSGDQYIFCQKDVLENEEKFYGRRGTELTPVCGYYIYYEKNDRMQAYMSQQRGGMSIEPEGVIKDRAAARFRDVMQEKQEQSSQKRTLAFLYTSCTFLVMVILVIGVTIINNYDRMEHMESAIHQISESLENSETMEAAVQKENEAARSEEGQAAETSEEIDQEVNQEVSEEPQEQEEISQEPIEEEPPLEEGTGETTEELQETLAPTVREPQRYQVKAGDTLMGISRNYYGRDDMVDEICEINELDDSDRIYEGEIILLP